MGLRLAHPQDRAADGVSYSKSTTRYYSHKQIDMGVPELRQLSCASSDRRS